MTNLIHDLIAGQSERHPSVPAVLSALGVMNYQRLESQSNQLARVLRDAGCRRGDRVCALTLASTTTTAIAIIAALKADAIFVALPSDCTSERLAEIARSADPSVILTTMAGEPRAEWLAKSGAVGKDAAVGVLDSPSAASWMSGRGFGREEIDRASSGPIGSHNRAGNAACLMFSTVLGSPGVVWTHAGLTRFVRWATEYFAIRSGDRHPILPPTLPDRAVCQMLAALGSGATLVEGQVVGLDPRSVARFVRRSEASLWWCAPETLSGLAAADVVSPGEFPGVRHLVCWGTGIAQRHFQYWRTRLPHTALTILIGAPETMMASSCYTIGDGQPIRDGQLPVGVACPGHEVLLLNEDRQPVPAGETGSIHVSGVGLSPGYWRSPEATIRAFGAVASGTGSRRSFPLGLHGRRGADGRIYAVPPAQVKAS